MISVALLVAAAALGLVLSTALRIPAAPLTILLGVALGSLAPWLDGVLVQDALLLAATLMIFVVASEIDPRHTRQQRPAALRLVGAHLGALAAAGLVLFQLLTLDPLTAVYLVLALATPSTLLVVDLLRQRGRFFEPTARLLLAVLLFQDVLAVIGLSLLGSIGRQPSDLGLALGGLLLLAVGAQGAGRWLMPFVFVRLRLDEDEQLLVVLALLFSFVGAAHFTGLPVVAGALFAGTALSRFPVAGLVRGRVRSFADLFTPLFYTALGATVTFAPSDESVALAGFLFALLVLLPPLLIPLLRRAGLMVRASLESVGLLAQCGEMSLVIGLVGLERGHLDRAAFGVVVFVAVISMSLAPLLSSDRVVWWLSRKYPARRQPASEPAPSAHVVLLGCGESGRVVLEPLLEAGVPVVVIDDDPGVVDDLAKRGVLALRGDGADPHVLATAGAEDAAVVVSTMRRIGDHERVLLRVKAPAVLARVFSEAEAERVRALGGEPVTESSLAAEAFWGWYEAWAGRRARPETERRRDEPVAPG